MATPLTASPPSPAAAQAMAAVGELAARLPAGAKDAAGRARAAAQDFEAVFLNAMFSQMFTAVDGEGPFGGAPGQGVWRSFLTDEYAKSFAGSGGIGLAPHVQSALLAQQAAGGRK